MIWRVLKNMKMKCEKREKKMHYKNENIYENKNIS